MAQVLRHLKEGQTAGADPNLLLGLESPDDAGVYRITPDLALVQTVDFFTPIVDDPYAWGAIAAANSMSDVHAMGAQPLLALNLVGWPRELDADLLARVMQGGADKATEGGVLIIGGHTVDDPEPKYGMAVTGTVRPEQVVRTTGARPGMQLVLTKPLSMGVISTALKRGAASLALIEQATAIMATLNSRGRGGDGCHRLRTVGAPAQHAEGRVWLYRRRRRDLDRAGSHTGRGWRTHRPGFRAWRYPEERGRLLLVG